VVAVALALPEFAADPAAPRFRRSGPPSAEFSVSFSGNTA
jgi:hypothetical protein